jgi:hypothetical protein
MTPNQTHFFMSLIGFVTSIVLSLLFSGAKEGDKSERSLFINIFGNSIHLHHWLYGSLFLIALLVIEYYFLNQQKLLFISFLKDLA